MDHRFRARYCSGRNPLETEVSVTVDGQDLMIHDLEAHALRWNFAQLRSESLVEGTRYLHQSSDATLLIYHELSEAYLALPGVDRTLQSSSLHKASKILVMLAATAILFVALYQSLDPVSQKLAQLISPQQERELFSSAALKSQDSCQSSRAAEILQELGHRLSRKEQTEAPIEFRLVDWDSPNAFAIPGRQVLVTTSLLKTLKTSEQLAAVLAHEIGHVHQRHNLQAFIRHSIATSLWALLVGDFSGAFVLDPQLIKSMSELSYSRELESAADHFSAQRMQELRMNPYSLITALEAIQARNERETELSISISSDLLNLIRTWLSTHPSLDQRKDSLISLGLPQESQAPLSPEAWFALKQGCK